MDREFGNAAGDCSIYNGFKLTVIFKSQSDFSRNRNLGRHSIGPAGAKSVAAMAAVVPSITRVDVRGNDIAGDGTTSSTVLCRATTPARVGVSRLDLTHTRPDDS